MRILATGGAGFIGSHLTDAFLARGDQVTVVNDLSAGPSRPGWMNGPPCTRRASRDAAALRAIVTRAQPELIFHLAARIDVRVSVTAPARDAQINIVGTVNVLEAARKVGARVLFASSGGALYGRDAPIPSRRRCRRCPSRLRHRQILRRAVHRPVQPVARHPA